MDRTSILLQNPILPFFEAKGFRFKKIGPEYYTNCPFHSDGKRGNFRVSTEGERAGLWYCDVCDFGGSVIDFVVRERGVEAGEAMKMLSPQESTPTQTYSGKSVQFRESPTTPPTEKDRIVATYDYVDETGTLRYQAVRLEPKSFRQRQPKDGGWEWNLKGVTRVLYNLPKVLKSTTPVWIVEGEKDADALNALGITATTNVCGAGKWQEAYSVALKGKNCVICPDNDEPGEKHKSMVMDALAEYARGVRCLKLPEPYKDVSDLIKAVGKDRAIEVLGDLFNEATEYVGGMELPVCSFEDLERSYIESIAEEEIGGLLDLGTWLPGLSKFVRPLVAGDFAVFLAATGLGKTAFLQNLVLQSGMETLFIEMEIVKPTIFERFIQMTKNTTGPEVRAIYQSGNRIDWRNDKRLDLIHTCDRGDLTTELVEKIIHRTELKLARKIRMVIIDYIQLIKGQKSQSRYDHFSTVAEELKRIAKATKTIVFTASQMSRKSSDEEVKLTDAKESGSIENSAGLVLGAWNRTSSDGIIIDGEINVKVLKCTRGKAGGRSVCLFNGEKMIITEKGKTADVPVR